MNKNAVIREAFEKGEGVLRLLPVFVPRRFSKPGRRLKLHPDDYYALGTKRGAIKERWFSSVINCMNGEDAAPDEGLSYAGTEIGPVMLKDFVDVLGAGLIGPELMDKYGTWPMYSKFFDYEDPLFHHVHLDFEAAARVGRLGKPEAYYYPPQLNNYPGTFPHTYFGFDPDVTPQMVRERLAGYEKCDTRITELSRAYRIELGTGWYTPPGVIHAPGSYLTYEPQWNSDVNSVYENVASGEVYPYEFLSENCPEKSKFDLDYILGLLDWEKNVDPHYKKTYFRPPVLSSQDESHTEKWVAYGNEYIAAKELTVQPGHTVTIKDEAAYGCIFVQGHGRFGCYDAEAPALIRFGQETADEYFVSEQAGREGVTVS
ncbi:MAG: hypothetical protein FWG03_09965, partial [Clostridiales bacterium]|nr:hypothetical protein [Clostridiales bacterium]